MNDAVQDLLGDDIIQSPIITWIQHSNCPPIRNLIDAVQDLHGEGIIVSPRMMADHMPDHITSVLGKMARSRRRHNPDFHAQAGAAVGSGAAGTTGPASSYLAIDIDSESEEESDPRR